MTKWDFLKTIFEWLTGNFSVKIEEIKLQNNQIITNQIELKELLMGAKELLEAFAVNVDDFGNACAASLAAVQAKLDLLNAKVVEGATPAEVGEALAEVNAHLDTVKAGLEALAAGGTTEVPPPPVDPPPPVEPL